MAVSKAEIERRMKRFAETCRAAGLKTTHQRMEVFRELAGTENHPDAETIYLHVSRRVPAISRDTVYRTLATLEGQGLVHKAEIVSGRARYDANTDHHHHFICTECGRVHDFYSPALDDLPIPRSVSALGRVDSAQVQLRGVCTNCAKNRR
jgi:Fur family peroxide stress response transcriptional regulator